ncbi:MAG: efflux RND transporter periplasmic adaptor subunit [Pirellulales bacterium]
MAGRASQKRSDANIEPPSQAAAASETRADDGPTVVAFSKEHQTSAGVRTAQVAEVEIEETITVTGKLAVDEDRLAHVYSMVDGVLREAPVKFGQDVKVGQLLAMVDSKEVGEAKLALARQRLNLGFARTNDDWAKTIHQNTQALIAALEKNPPVKEIEAKFRDQPMGDNRQLLVAGYAKYEQTKADYERLHTLREQNVGVEKDYIRAKAEYEASAATYQAVLEQLKFTTKQRLLESDQKLQEAVTAERMGRASLLILGYGEPEIEKMDPLAEGEAVAHYPIRAPFNGTVIGKHAVLSEQVGPTHQLYEIADLSRVWLLADVFEKDLPR